MKRVLTVLFAATMPVLPPRGAEAQQVGTCAGMIPGYEAWAGSGPQEAVRRWLEGSAIPAGEELVNAMAQLEKMYGEVTGHEVIRDVAITPSIRRIYVAALHRAAPSFGYFDCYRTDGRWTVTNIQLHSNAREILPPDAFWSDGWQGLPRARQARGGS